MNDEIRLVAEELTKRSQTLATAESLTGGGLGAAITGVPGASNFYLGGVVTYATSMKTLLLGVPRSVIEEHTVISAEVARAMATGVRRLTGADWAVSVTGVAGPDPQDGHEPGEVWIAVAGQPDGDSQGSVTVVRHDFVGDRAAVRVGTIEAACLLLLRALTSG